MLSDYNSFVCASPDNQDNTAHFSKIYICITPYAIQKDILRMMMYVYKCRNEYGLKHCRKKFTNIL